MTDADLVYVFSSAAVLAMKVSTPVLVAAMVVGLVVSLFQALTQIHEATLTFVPKVIVMVLVFWYTLPWVVREITGFIERMFVMAAEVTR